MWKNYVLAESLDQAVAAMADAGEGARIIAGGTDLILEIERGVRKGIHTIIDISKIPDLDRIYEDQNSLIHIGPLVTHNHVVASSLIRNKAFALLQACWEVGSPQIRNRGTIAGNLITASPANDTISPLMAFDAKVTLLSSRGERIVPLADFYGGVRQTVMETDEIMTDIFFEAPGPHHHSFYIKTALRKAQAISVINLTIFLKIDDEKVASPQITLGAVAPTIIHANKAEE
ncbi:MAG: FAD binding domain-containing protein [Anaerolineales bacterium]